MQCARLAPLAALLALVTAGAASAAPLSFRGTLSIAPLTGGVFEIGSGQGILNNLSDSPSPAQLTIDPGLLSYSTQIPLLGAGPITAFTVVGANAEGLFNLSLPAGTGPGLMPLAGSLRLCGQSDPSGCVLTLLEMPLTDDLRGIGGLGGPPVVGTGLTSVSLFGSHWTLGTASAIGAYSVGSAMGPLGNPTTALAAGGTLQLVTPVIIRTNAIEDIQLFVRLELEFLPEPAPGLLLAGASFALFARARRQSRR